MDGHATGWGQVAIFIGQHQIFEEVVRVWLIGEAFEHDDEAVLIIVDRHNERAVVHARLITDFGFFFFFGKPAFMSA